MGSLELRQILIHLTYQILFKIHLDLVAEQFHVLLSFRVTINMKHIKLAMISTQHISITSIKIVDLSLKHSVQIS